MSDETAVIIAFICLVIDVILLIHLTSDPTKEQLKQYEEYEDGNTNNF
jgi:hypothetical protein